MLYSIDSTCGSISSFIICHFAVSLTYIFFCLPSNATFQLPGLLGAHVFEDEDDIPNSLYKVSMNDLPAESGIASEETDTCAFTPSDRNHHILEDVDGELEMEDVSASSKDEKGVSGNEPLSLDQWHQTERSSESIQNMLPPLPVDPPLPLDSPPPPPPLPPSPPPSPPPPPPPLSPSPPPPPPTLPPPPSVPPPPGPSSPPVSLLYHPKPQEYCRTPTVGLWACSLCLFIKDASNDLFISYLYRPAKQFR